MKIQCDVCGREAASVFCCADEAALCSACDRSIHHANKLAGKHRRLPLLLPSASSVNPHPLCDICQEKRGFVFCREDRAILCKDCDAPIHDASQITMKHSRFLLTGVRLSATSALLLEPEEPEHSTNNSSKGSSISEYLIKMLPGWRVDDLLIDDAVAGKTNELPPFLEADLATGRLEDKTEEFPIWVPQMPQIPPPNPPAAAFSGGDAEHRHGFRPKEVVDRDRWGEDAFTVPQISPALGSNKRPRPSFWYF